MKKIIISLTLFTASVLTHAADITLRPGGPEIRIGNQTVQCVGQAVESSNTKCYWGPDVAENCDYIVTNGTTITGRFSRNFFDSCSDAYEKAYRAYTESTGSRACDAGGITKFKSNYSKEGIQFFTTVVNSKTLSFK